MRKQKVHKKKKINYIILELAENGELYALIELGAPFSESVALFYAKQFL